MTSPLEPPGRRMGFAEDFRRFFKRGLSALLPTLITIWLLVRIWDFLWEGVGRHLIWLVKRIWLAVDRTHSAGYVRNWFGMGGEEPELTAKLLGVGLAIIVVYVVGLFIGNIIGRTGWRLLELLLTRVPLVRQIYPAVKQVTDFLLAEKGQKFKGGRVVACRPHSHNIWSVGLVTGSGLEPIRESMGREMVTVFIPSSPTVVSGYVVMVPRDEIVDLPMTVEQALRLLVTGGVVTGQQGILPAGGQPTAEQPTVLAPSEQNV